MLNNTKIKSLKPGNKIYRVSDTNGLVLEVKTSGVLSWRYRFEGRASMMALGNYPDVSLAEARRKRDAAREMLDKGINPTEKKDEQVVVDRPVTFGEMYLEWYEHNKADWSENYADDVHERCSNHLLPNLKDRRIADITAMDM